VPCFIRSPLQPASSSARARIAKTRIGCLPIHKDESLAWMLRGTFRRARSPTVGLLEKALGSITAKSTWRRRQLLTAGRGSSSEKTGAGGAPAPVDPVEKMQIAVSPAPRLA
jgi:hypothetical protein